MNRNYHHTHATSIPPYAQLCLTAHSHLVSTISSQPEGRMVTRSNPIVGAIKPTVDGEIGHISDLSEEDSEMVHSSMAPKGM